MTRHADPSSATPISTPHAAFTLVELLVVISIILLVMGMSIPVLSAMQRGGRVSAGVNTVNVAVTAARAYAGQKSLGGDFANVDGIGGTGTYDGVAAIFTPGGEVRLVINDATARDQAGKYIESDATLKPPTAPIHNAYKDIPGREPIRFPRSTGIAGWRRQTVNESAAIRSNGVAYFKPPFALRFNANGVLISRPGVSTTPTVYGTYAEDGHVYYDSDGDGDITTNNSDGNDAGNPFGAGAYDVNEWDWRLNPAGKATLLTTLDPPRRKLPFEKIDSVDAVVVFDLIEFNNAGGWGMLPADFGNWMEANGKLMLFSRVTGNSVRE